MSSDQQFVASIACFVGVFICCMLVFALGDVFLIPQLAFFAAQVWFSVGAIRSGPTL